MSFLSEKESTLDLANEKEFINIKEMYDSYTQDIQDLENLIPTQLPSFISSYKDMYRKVFIIACANAFERHLCRILPELFSCNSFLQHFIQKQALDRKYHTLFAWKENNANQFYGLFGKEFKKQMGTILEANTAIKEGETSFMAIGRYRNLVAHEGFDTNPFNEDIDSIKNKFDEALAFYKCLLNELKKSISLKTSEQAT